MTWPPSPTSVVLTLVGVALMGWWTVIGQVGYQPAWALVLASLALACWAARTVLAWLGLRRTATVLAVAGALVGAIAAPAAQGNSLVATAVCLLVLVGDPGLPLSLGVAAGLAATALVGIGALLHPVGLPAVATMLAVPAVAALGGFSRRQSREARRREALLTERDATMREEATRVALARDLHDVLAHTLGGLVVQLDAAEALLDAGQPAAARERVAGARTLAASGLGEARRAVAALRTPLSPEPRTPDRLRATMDDLVDAHRALGGTVELTRTGSAVPLTGEQAVALERALQESLSNARRHAPGAPVTAVLEWQSDRVRLTISNPLRQVAADRPAGRGYGLVGMGERFAALPLGGSATAEEIDGRFVVRAEARLR